MSVTRTGDGRFLVRWREGGRGSAQRKRTFDRRRDADRFELEVRRRKSLGSLASLDAGQITLAAWIEEWWRAHAVPNLADSTRRRYVEVWDTHVLKRLGGYKLRELTPRVIDRFREDLTGAGVGDPTILIAMTVLSSALRLAVVREEIAANPMREIRKPRQTTTRRPRPLTPEAVEALRAHLPIRDATLVSVLAYAGLRPGEALTLRWESVEARALDVYAPKTRRRRTVNLLAPLAQDLLAWRMASEQSRAEHLLFPRPDEEPWRDTDFRNWRRRVFRRAAEAAGQPKEMTPYWLRHSFASLLISEGQSPLAVAAQLGHSPAVCLATYAHLFDGWDHSERVPAEQRIRDARAGSDTGMMRVAT